MSAFLFGSSAVLVSTELGQQMYLIIIISLSICIYVLWLSNKNILRLRFIVNIIHSNVSSMPCGKCGKGKIKEQFSLSLIHF